MAGRCRACVHFCNNPAYLESVFSGMTALSSAWGSTRAEDGLCLKHDRYLSADAGCSEFTPAERPADAPSR
ncbi:MAG TPA: hypothetical protein VKV32_15400 [Stellaceae bacterium]|nr:hypothetical protein [Stellaceae bacterium]